MKAIREWVSQEWPFILALLLVVAFAWLASCEACDLKGA